jgi:hypothetical protein
MKICAVCSEKMDKKEGQSEMAKKIEEIRSLRLQNNHTEDKNIHDSPICFCKECYEEKDSNYWFEEWELGMRSGKMKFQDWWEEGVEDTEKELTKTQQEREEEEDKMEEMRAIWEDRRMIERLKKDRG